MLTHETSHVARIFNTIIFPHQCGGHTGDDEESHEDCGSLEDFDQTGGRETAVEVLRPPRHMVGAWRETVAVWDILALGAGNTCWGGEG